MKTEADVLALAVKPLEWTDERVELLKRTVTPQECSDDEFRLFLEQCKHTGLNPFLKQAFMVERRAKLMKNGREEWISHFEFQAAEVGMAARANGFHDFRGMRGAAVYEKDTFEIDSVEQKVTHRFSPNKDRGRLVGAWAHAIRDGHVQPITFLPLGSRIQTNKDGKPNRFWSVMPEGQIAKCARAEQYRLAYPQIFSGVNIPEEVPEEEDVTPDPEPTPNKGGTRTQSVTQHLERIQTPKARLLESGGLDGKDVANIQTVDLERFAQKARDWISDGRNKTGRAKMERDLEKMTFELNDRAAKRAEAIAANAGQASDPEEHG